MHVPHSRIDGPSGDKRQPDKIADAAQPWNGFYESAWDGTAQWSPVKRRWHTIFATIIYLAVYVACYVLMPVHWAGLIIGWIPASMFATIAYLSPADLLLLLIEFLGAL